MTMKNFTKQIALWAVVALLLVVVPIAASAQQWTETVLHNFTGNQDGKGPEDVWPLNGNWYGLTAFGGIASCNHGMGCGTAYQLTPSGGGWTKTEIYTFGVAPSDGNSPLGGLISDGDGNLYGATERGGKYSGGTVFELSPGPDGTWTEKVLNAFGNGSSDGLFPGGRLVFDTNGNLYGSTSGGGGNNCSCGTVFKLSPSPSGSWTESIIFDFDTSGGQNGYMPNPGLIFDTAGNLYGTTFSGYTGSLQNAGVVYQLVPQPSGTWTMNTLHTFPTPTTGTFGEDGAYPLAGLLIDPSGNLFGTTQAGGIHLCNGSCVSYGTVYEISPSGGGWKEQVIYKFTNTNGDGYFALSVPIADSNGNLYATTTYGGNNQACLGGCGTVFELIKTASGWTYTLLWDFNYNDGWNPWDVTLQNGVLYGTAINGGTENGVVYELSAS